MVYSNKFVMCVLLNGRPQKEKANGVVPLPFGTEYALRFRNKNSRRAVVKIYIDGENVSGEGYIVNAHSHVDIKRHHDVDRAFKFVSLDSEAAIDYGKDGPNEDKTKGTIEARFHFEKELPPQPQVIYRDVHHDHHHHYPRPKPWPLPPIVFPCTDYTTTCGGGGTSSSLGGPISSSGMNANYGDPAGTFADGAEMSQMSCSKGGIRGQRNRHRTNIDCDIATFKRISSHLEELKDGCTVEGHNTGQSFHTVWCETEDTFTSLKIFLQGFGEDEEEMEEVAESQPIKRRKTNKESQIDDLEAENKRLRRQLAELENENLKALVDKKLARVDELNAKKPVKKRVAKKRTTKKKS